MAVDVIVSEGAVERAIHHACGNALVCDTMEVARYVCYEKGQEIKGKTLLYPLSSHFVDLVMQLLHWREP